MRSAITEVWYSMSLTTLLPIPRLRPHSVECTWNATGRSVSALMMEAAMPPSQSWTQAMSNFTCCSRIRLLTNLAEQRMSLVKMELKNFSWSPQDWSSLPAMMRRMPDASTLRGRCTSTPWITSLVFSAPVFMVKTTTSAPMRTWA